MTLDFYALERGFALPPFDFTIGRAEVVAYLEATGAPTDDWYDTVPPLALGALALAGIMERLPLPPGAVHAGQEFEFRRGVAPGTPLEARVVLVQSQERRGSLISVLEITLTEAGATDDPVLAGRTTVLAPARRAVVEEAGA